ncbi:MAG TPA: SAM-dependent methyltransferase [Accumulibacter sp.]|nr:SAM-dependent methyltransferase [Accumulibacter sp.]
MASLPELRPGQSIELLKELHILTRDGKINQDSRRKLKQVRHLCQFIEPLLDELVAANAAPTLVDHGAGKSYLGFILYDLFFQSRARGHIYGIEARAELVERSRELAERLGFARMSFHHLNIAAALEAAELVERSRELAERLGFARMSFHHLNIAAALEAAELPTQIDIVTALHACDTATDDAIRFALHRQARFIVLAPCCQAEVAAHLRRNKNIALAATPLAEMWRHPLHSREFGSQLTNVLRSLQLEAHGYQVTVTELVGWEHSLKNELIIARRTGNRRGNASERIEQILRQLHLEELRGRFID